MLTVLLIEDDPGDAQILRVWLGLEVPGQYRLLQADRLAAAVAILDSQASTPALLPISASPIPAASTPCAPWKAISAMRP